MFRALVLKELREVGWIALVALVAQLAFVASNTGLPILFFFSSGEVNDTPFLDNDFISPFCFISVLFAVTLGLRQTTTESQRGTWLFLLHRPASMRRVIAAKLAVGAGLYLLCGSIAILSYAAWAATPGKHAGPFHWWMTVDVWKAWGLIGVVYLGAFLAGIRPARWFGTRLFPLAAAAVLVGLLAVALVWPVLGIAALLLVAAWLVGLVQFVARSRDFS